MKKTLISLVAIGALSLAGTAMAKISGSHHDMTSAGVNVDSSISACEFCHTPHNSNADLTNNGSGARLPLWNRSSMTGTTYQMYGLTVNMTSIDGGVSQQPGANSLTCLSCHDGTVALNSTYNGAVTGSNFIGAANFDRAFIDTDLRDDHPVGFAFVSDTAGAEGHGVPDDAFRNNNASSAYNFRLYGATGTFECASCHDPHDTETGDVTPDATPGLQPGDSSYFLRSPWATICVDCHQNK